MKALKSNPKRKKMALFESAIKALKDINSQVDVGVLDEEKIQLINEIEDHIVNMAENILQIHSLEREIEDEKKHGIVG